MSTARAGRGSDLNELQIEMAQIRHKMHEEVRGAVRGAQTLTDWRLMVASHPWAALGAAAAVGFLIVPWRKARRAEEARLAAAVIEASQARPVVQVQAPPARASVTRWAFSLLTPVIIRAAQNYALNQVEHWLAAQATQFQDNESDREREPGQRSRSGPGLGLPTIPFRDRR